MDKVVFNLGGQELSGDDLEFIQAATLTAFEGAVKQHSDNYVLTGAQFTGSAMAGYNLTEGFVVINGEVYKVDARTYPAVAIIAPSFVPVQTMAKQKVNKNGSTVDVRLVRKATVESTLTDGRSLNRMDNVWRKVGDDGGATTLLNSFTHDANAPLEYRRIGNKVELRGKVDVAPAINTSVLIFMLPGVVSATLPGGNDGDTGYRPIRNYRLPVVGNTGTNICQLVIDTAGNVGITGTVTSQSSVQLDGVCFYLN